MEYLSRTYPSTGGERISPSSLLPEHLHHRHIRELQNIPVNWDIAGSSDATRATNSLYSRLMRHRLLHTVYHWHPSSVPTRHGGPPPQVCFLRPRRSQCTQQARSGHEHDSGRSVFHPEDLLGLPEPPRHRTGETMGRRRPTTRSPDHGKQSTVIVVMWRCIYIDGRLVYTELER